jgi:hypothetical protein
VLTHGKKAPITFFPKTACPAHAQACGSFALLYQKNTFVVNAFTQKGSPHTERSFFVFIWTAQGRLLLQQSFPRPLPKSR